MLFGSRGLFGSAASGDFGRRYPDGRGFGAGGRGCFWAGGGGRSALSRCCGSVEPGFGGRGGGRRGLAGRGFGVTAGGAIRATAGDAAADTGHGIRFQGHLPLTDRLGAEVPQRECNNPGATNQRTNQRSGSSPTPRTARAPYVVPPCAPISQLNRGLLCSGPRPFSLPQLRASETTAVLNVPSYQPLPLPARVPSSPPATVGDIPSTVTLPFMLTSTTGSFLCPRRRQN